MQAANIIPKYNGPIKPKLQQFSARCGIFFQDIAKIWLTTYFMGSSDLKQFGIS